MSNILFEDTENDITVEYDYEDIFEVNGIESFHVKIRNDDNFAANYFGRLGHRVDEVAGEETTDINDSHSSNNPAATTNLDDSVPIEKQRVVRQLPDEAVPDDEAWDNAAIKFLLNEYLIRKDRFRNPKIKKVVLWREIQVEFERIGRAFSASELSKKFGNMKTTYSKIKKNNSKKTTGTGRKSWPWLSQMDEIFHSDLSINFSSNVVASMRTEDNAEPINLSRSPPCNENTSVASMNITLSNAPTSKVMADSFDDSSSELAPSYFKSAKVKNAYYYRQKQFDLDSSKLDMLKSLSSKFDAHKNLQEKAMTIWNDRMSEITQALKERNEILKTIAKSLQDQSQQRR